MNQYIQTWKNTIKILIDHKKLIYETLSYNNGQEYTLSMQINDIRELASKQLKMLDENRPNKDESMYKQANEIQKEFIDYLEQVIIYGNIEGKDNTK